MRVDMHTHTLYSDGLNSPKKLIDLALEKNLSGISITDHDTVDGLDEAAKYAKTKKGFILVAGIEFGCVYDNKEVHLLGYFINYKDTELMEVTKKLKESRIQRGKKMVKKLSDLGLDLDIEDVRKFASDDYVGRPHIARALIEKKYVKDINQAFEKYLERGASAYVDRFQLSISESIQLIHKINGISVLAHPALIQDRKIIDLVISLGIDGIECFHSKHTEEDTKELLKIANDNNLLVTGGSDYHGDEDILGDYYIDLNKSPGLKRRFTDD